MAHPTTEQPIRIRLEEPDGSTALLRVYGEVDMLTSPALRVGIAEQLASDRNRLLIDLDGVEFLGTSGLAALVEARASAGERNTELWLVCANRRVLRPLEIAGLGTLFSMADTVTAALEDRGARPA